MTSASLGAALLTVLFALARYELEEWFPRIVRAMLTVAIGRLPKRARARYHEEWLAHLEDVPGAVMKLFHCFGFVRASGKMYPRWQRSVAHRKRNARSLLAVRATVRFLDLAVAISILFAVFPLLCFVGMICAIYGPMLQRHPVLGRDGKSFYIYKFRTQCAPECVRKEPPLLHFIKNNSLDELPGIFSIIKGNASLIPEMSPLNLIETNYASHSERHKFSTGRHILLTVKCYFCGLYRLVISIFIC